MGHREAMKEAGVIWGEMTEAEKKPYKDMQKEDQ